MNRLYNKSEIWFAVLWIIIYVAGASIADALSADLGTEKIITFPFLAVLSISAVGWILKNGLSQKYGLCRSSQPASRFLFYLPLVLLASRNLWFGARMNMPAHETALYVGSMLCVGLLEELIFRGFLFRAMQHDSLKWAIVVSSVTFGIGHIVNLVNGSGADVLSTLCQIVGAIAFGFLFVILFHRGGSLWPCILCHGVLNSLSAFSAEGTLSSATQIVLSLLLAGIACAYAGILLKTLPAGEK